MSRVIPNEQTWVGFAALVTTAAAINEVQTVSVGAASAGTFTLILDGQTTAAIPFGATPAAIITALEALNNIGVGDVTATGTLAASVTLTFVNVLAGRQISSLTGVGTGLTGGALVLATVTNGTPAGLVPTTAEINAAIVLTDLLMGLNASSTGNVVPTPSLDTLFETSIIGTSQATFSADFYRDDLVDKAWDTLPRGAKGFFIISRFGGAGVNQKPVIGDYVEVWPVQVVSRTAANMANNAVQTFSITASINVEPNESALILV